MREPSHRQTRSGSAWAVFSALVSAWVSSNARLSMSPNTKIFLGIVVGSVMTLASWAWLLADGCSLGRLLLGSFLTAAFVGIGSIWTIKAGPPVSGPNPVRLVSGLITGAFAVALIGAPVLIWQTVPGRWGAHGTFLERRYSALFFGISAYLALVQLISNAWANRE